MYDAANYVVPPTCSIDDLAVVGRDVDGNNCWPIRDLG
jgi:hypothetical protein